MKNDICTYKENNVDEILPNLWLGNYQSSLDIRFLKKNNIRYVIRLTKTVYREYPDIIYINIPISDDELCNENIDFTGIFNKTSDFIKEVLVNNYGILVHCKRGHHRSASIVAAFLIKYIKVDYTTSISYINNIRKCALRRNTCIGKNLYKYYLMQHNKYCRNVVCSKYNRLNMCSCILSS